MSSTGQQLFRVRSAQTLIWQLERRPTEGQHRTIRCKIATRSNRWWIAEGIDKCTANRSKTLLRDYNSNAWVKIQFPNGMRCSVFQICRLLPAGVAVIVVSGVLRIEVESVSITGGLAAVGR